MPTVFLSHSSKDKRFVRRLAEGLEAYDVQVWLDEVELGIGQPLLERIKDGISRADYLIVLISSNSMSSQWVWEEIRIAEEIEQEKERSIVLPVLMEEVDEKKLGALLQDRIYADFRPEFDFEISLVTVLRTMGVLKSFAETIAEIDDQPNFRPHAIQDIHQGRYLLKELSFYRELEVPHYREWLLWELLYWRLNGDYSVEVTLGVKRMNEVLCSIKDPSLGTELSVTLPEAKAVLGVWEFGQGAGFGNFDPINTEEPFVTAGNFATHFGMPDDLPDAPNPAAVSNAKNLQSILKECQALLQGATADSISSMLFDLHIVALGVVGRPTRLYIGSIRFSPAARKQATNCMFEKTVRFQECDTSGEGILYLQIDDEFFRTSNCFFLCREHRNGIWKANVNLFKNNGNHPVLAAN